ncbi:hypothetical protein [Dysgonomonas reticulitermitis]
MKYICVIIVIIAIATTTMWLNSYSKLQQEKEECKQTSSNILFLNNDLKEDQNALIQNEGCFLDTTLILTDLKNNPIKIDSLFLNGTYLVLFFSSEHCGDCVNYSLTQLRNFLLNTETNKILIFASKYRLRDLFVFARSHQFDDKIFYNIESLNIPIEQIHKPFMFLINKNLRPTHFFIPKKEIPDQTDNYLSIMKTILNIPCHSTLDAGSPDVRQTL